MSGIAIAATDLSFSYGDVRAVDGVNVGALAFRSCEAVGVDEASDGADDTLMGGDGIDLLLGGSGGDDIDAGSDTSTETRLAVTTWGSRSIPGPAHA